jgi:hypothetical protein
MFYPVPQISPTSPLHYSTLVSSSDGANGTFGLGDYDADGRKECVFVKSRNTQSGTVEAHVMPIPRSTDTN